MGKVKGVSEVKANLRKTVGKISGAMTEKVVTQILIAGQSASDRITPVDTSNLINSKFREVKRTSYGYRGTAAYTAEYAAYVHEATGKLKGQKRPKNRGVYWGPDGEPQFLKKGFERDAKEEIQQIIKAGYK